METSNRVVPGGFIVWFTGLSGAGKTTLASAVSSRLATARPVEVLDGDEVRRTLCRDLGYSRPDRMSNVSRVSYVATLLARNAVAVVVALISPYRDGRADARARAALHGVPFIEVYVWASLETVIARDTKGLYQQAMVGALTQFTGISDPYEIPESPDLAICTDQEAVDDSVARVISLLQQRRLIA